MALPQPYVSIATPISARALVESYSRENRSAQNRSKTRKNIRHLFDASSAEKRVNLLPQVTKLHIGTDDLQATRFQHHPPICLFSSSAHCLVTSSAHLRCQDTENWVMIGV